MSKSNYYEDPRNFDPLAPPKKKGISNENMERSFSWMVWRKLANVFLVLGIILSIALLVATLIASETYSPSYLNPSPAPAIAWVESICIFVGALLMYFVFFAVAKHIYQQEKIIACLQELIKKYDK